MINQVCYFQNENRPSEKQILHLRVKVLSRMQNVKVFSWRNFFLGGMRSLDFIFY